MPKALPRILVVDDEAQNLKALERTLRGQFEIVSTTSPKQALALIEKEEFAVVISDQKMPQILGTELLAQIAAKKPLISRIILSAYTETKEMLDAINRAAIFRYIIKPWDNEELISSVMQAVIHHQLRNQNVSLIEDLEKKNKDLKNKEQDLLVLNENLENLVEERTAELKKANEQLNELAMTDPLTAILNRRAFFSKFQDEVVRSERYVHRISVAMIDVDHFKSFNDMEGHVFGDEALKGIVRTIVKNIRKTDVLCRYGGEEFALMMPETEISVAREICERLKNSVETTPMQGKQGTAYLTVSVGLSGYPQDGKSSADLIQAADRALYHAKESGRNCVVIYRKSNSSFFLSE